MLKYESISADPLKIQGAELLGVDPILSDLSTSNDFGDRTTEVSVNLAPELTSALDLPVLDPTVLDLPVLDPTVLDLPVLDPTVLDLTDAAVTDPLFDLEWFDRGASSSTAASTSSAYRVRTSAYDPIDFGDPITDGRYWRQQQGSASCAVVAQIAVYESLTGRWISETDAANYAQAKGWFSPTNGTETTNTGRILNDLNIRTYGGYNADLIYLAAALDKGDKPLVALDANEIWNPQRNRYGNPVEQPNEGHLVWVTGIDIKPNGTVNVILNDSGVSYGRGEVVNAVDFLNAWQDRNFYVLVADNPYR